MNGYQNTNEEQSFDLLDIITISSLILQLIDHDRTTKQIGNNEIMRELQKHTSVYLERIIRNQEEILSKLAD